MQANFSKFINVRLTPSLVADISYMTYSYFIYLTIPLTSVTGTSAISALSGKFLSLADVFERGNFVGISVIRS